MALLKTIQKTFPGSVHHMGLRLQLTDDDRADLGPGPQTVIDEVITENYSGGAPTPAIITALTKEAQDRIDDYKTRRTRYTHPLYHDAIADIAAAVNV